MLYNLGTQWENYIYFDCSHNKGELCTIRQLFTMYAHELLGTFAGRCATRKQDGDCPVDVGYQRTASVFTGCIH